MAESDPQVYFNGEFVGATDARVPIDDRGLLHGLGFFETFRTSGGRPHHWPYNRRRLERACATAGLAIPPRFLAADEARLGEAVGHLLRANGQADAVCRYTLTAGSGGNPAEFLALRPLPPVAPPEGIGLRVLQLTRDNGEFLPRPKSLNYANALLGADELARRPNHPGDEGLFLSREGRFVVETPRQNVAWLVGDELRFPDPSVGSVAGTCLQWLLKTSGLRAAPRRAPLDELLDADAVFVCNAVRGVTPVREIWDSGDRAVMQSVPSAAHPRVRALMKQWDDSLRATASNV